MFYTVINKEQVIKEVAKREGIPLSTLQSAYWTLENYIFETLSSATPTEKIELKLFNGISIDCEYKHSKEMIHPESGDLFETKEGAHVFEFKVPLTKKVTRLNFL